MAEIIRSYKNAYSGHPRDIWVLFVLTIINRMGTMVFPFLTVYLTTILGFPLSQAGVLAGAFGFGALAGSYLGGRLTDQIGSRFVITATLMINGIVLITLQFASAFTMILGLLFAAGLFGEAYRPAVMASVGNYVSKSETGRSMSLIRLAISLGMTMAPAIGGFVAVAYGYQWLFWIDGGTCIIAGLYYWYAAQAGQPTTKQAKEIAAGTITDRKPWRDKNYILFLLATFIMGFGFIQWFHTIPVFIKSVWGFDERYIGILMGMHSILIVLFELPVIHAIEKAGKMKLSVLAGLAFTGFSFLPFLLPATLAYCFLAMILFTIAGILYLPFNNAIPLNMSPDTLRGEYMAWYWMIWSLTNITGPVVGFAFAETFGFSTFWIFISLLVGVSFLMNLILAKRIIA